MRSKFLVVIMAMFAIPVAILGFCVMLLFDVQMPEFSAAKPEYVAPQKQPETISIRLSPAEQKYLIANASSKYGNFYRGFINGMEYWIRSND
jgi:hypothetical protein